MRIHIAAFQTTIDSNKLSTGEQLFIQRLTKKTDEGKILNPKEQLFIKQMSDRGQY